MKHKHHIIPEHMGGTDDPSNFVELTIEEHAEAHRILWEKFGRWQDEVAWKGLAGIIGHEEAVSLSISKALSERIHTEESKEKRRKWNVENGHKPPGCDQTGFKHSDETKEHLRSIAIEQNAGNRFPRLAGDLSPSRRPEIRKLISERMIGNKNAIGLKSEEHKRKIGLANIGKNKGRIPWNKGLKK